MKPTVKKIAAILTTGASLWVAAPALSTAPFIPEAEDFTQTLPQVERLDNRASRATTDVHGPIRFITPEIEAPQRFDLVGLPAVAQKDVGVELRTRENDGQWSEWVEPAGSDPVWAGGADFVQLRAHDRIPAGELHYVNVSGDGDPLSGALTAARESVNGAFIAAAAGFGVDSAVAARAGEASKPKIIKRKAWGAEGKNGCEPRQTPDYGRVKATAIHHTVSTNGYSEEQAAGLVLGICRYHVNGNGWDDIGYNFLVDAYGNTYEGRAGGIRRAVVGAHSQGYNSLSTGVAVIGNHTETPATKATKFALKQLLSWKLSHHGKRATGRARMLSGGGAANRYEKGTRVRISRIFPHSEANFTECSGDSLRAQLPRLRIKVQKRIDRFADKAPAEEQTDPPAESKTGGVKR